MTDPVTRTSGIIAMGLILIRTDHTQGPHTTTRQLDLPGGLADRHSLSVFELRWKPARSLLEAFWNDGWMGHRPMLPPL
ncbi:hypothetical protein VTN77DRAFT_8997 [Rasamsonia byssochlamydoides]|uniref:uncharacterized protein n=1 Tax=Rasamsonia byssochlamydoides TaxID=89139 RepID=UPI003744316E